MKVFDNPARSEWSTLLQRPVAEAAKLEALVSGILQQVKTGGDSTVKALTLQFDKAVVDDLLVSEACIKFATLCIDLSRDNRSATRGRFNDAVG